MQQHRTDEMQKRLIHHYYTNQYYESNDAPKAI